MVSKAIVSRVLVLSLFENSFEVCNRSALNNALIPKITMDYPYEPLKTDFYTLKNWEEIVVVRFDESELCEGMIKDFPNLGTLEFRNGSLTRIEPGTFQNLERLRYVTFLNHHLTTIQKGVFNTIESLLKISLINNDISIIEEGAFSNMPNLVRIYLDKNKITQLNGNIFNESPNLRFILVTLNKITKIAQNAFDDLKSVSKRITINLEYNSIEHFDAKCVQNLPVPLVLHLSQNKITNYADIVMSSRKNSAIILRNNSLSHVPNDVLYDIASRHVHLYLEGNTLTCDFVKRIEDMDEEAKRWLRKRLHTDCNDGAY